MGLRGPKPKGKVMIKWSPNFAYAIGLLVTDGNLSPDGRHIAFVSKDMEQITNLQKALGITCLVTKTRSGYKQSIAFRSQFGDVLFYSFLNNIGVTANKSKTIGRIDVPEAYYKDFLRGCFDGDGSFHSYYDTRWKQSFMFYTSFVSASYLHIEWLCRTSLRLFGVRGHVTHAQRSTVYQLKYAKVESLKILKNMYYSDSVICLSRKKKKIEKVLRVAVLDS